MAADVEERAERFARGIAEMRIEDPAPTRPTLWLRIGGALMLVGLACAVAAVIRSQGSTDPLVQRDALALGQAGIASAIVGTGIYLRYSVTKVLRFWFARIAFDLDHDTQKEETPR